MSFFAIQVQTNYELFVQKSIALLVLEKKINLIKNIYALDTQVSFKENHITNEDIKSYLEHQRIRSYLNNMRYAYSEMKMNKNEELKKEYKLQMKNLIKKIKSYPENQFSQKVVVKGYILIELNRNFEKIPSSLYYDIKSIPKVIGFPSHYNIPQNEIDDFYEKFNSYLINQIILSTKLQKIAKRSNRKHEL